jgi:para-aminobenzoate synthetase/4-amino-4-deoxychorismate lyase
LLPVDAPARLRLCLHHDGRFELSAARLDALPGSPVGLLLAAAPADDVPFPRHKTSLRRRYDAALAAAGRCDAFDVVFANRVGQLTEGARSNVFLRLDGAWYTPALAAGLLPGVMRAVLLDNPVWSAREALLTVADLRRAEAVVVCNALRGPLAARVVGVLEEDDGDDLPALLRAAGGV